MSTFKLVDLIPTSIPAGIESPVEYARRKQSVIDFAVELDGFAVQHPPAVSRELAGEAYVALMQYLIESAKDGYCMTYIMYAMVKYMHDEIQKLEDENASLRAANSERK